MKIQECIKILGKPINSEDVKAFLEEYQFKYPKTDTISNRKPIDDRSYWVESKKNKTIILFDCVINNSSFKPLLTSKKGTYYPLSTDIRFEDNSKIEDLPFGLKAQMTFEEIVNLIGKPQTKSSEVASTWLNDDGTESWYRWTLPLKQTEHLYLEVQFNTEKPLTNAVKFGIFIFQEHNLFHLFDEMKDENIQTYLQTIDNRKVSDLMFVKWAIENDFCSEGFISKDTANKIKTGQIKFIDFIKTIHKAYISVQDFSKYQNEIRRYLKNLNTDNIYYYGDFCKQFLKSKKLIDNYLGKDAQENLDKIEFNEENYQVMKQVLDKRLNNKN